LARANELGFSLHWSYYELHTLTFGNFCLALSEELATKATMDITPKASQAEAMHSTKIKLALDELSSPEHS
jgi:hypothetical protein